MKDRYVLIGHVTIPRWMLSTPSPNPEDALDLESLSPAGRRFLEDIYEDQDAKRQAAEAKNLPGD